MTLFSNEIASKHYPKQILLIGFGGFWGMIAVGLFAEKDLLEGFSAHAGLFHGGGFYLLGVQFLACVCCTLWSGTTTFLIIKVAELQPNNQILNFGDF